MYIVILDTMGSDLGVEEVVRGGLDSLGKLNEDLKVIMVGPAELINKEIQAYDKKFGERIQLVDCQESITNYDAPTSIVKDKKNCSMAISFGLLNQTDNSVLISAGNTGAVMVGGTLVVGRQKGLDRLALAVNIPISNMKSVLMLDVGANVDCKPEYLLQFANVATQYLKSSKIADNPNIGLLNIGSEEGKGNTLAKSAYELLKNSELNFGGNVEARDVLKGKFDIVVCDGFWGNIFIKTLEGVGDFLKAKLPAQILIEGSQNMSKFIDSNKLGGAVLLGAKKLIFKAHGNSNSEAICNTIIQAYNSIGNKQ